MKKYDQKSVVVFTHIMKTAGRSLNELFKTLWGSAAVVEIYERRTTMWDYYQRRRNNTLRYVGGHIDYGVHEWLGLEQVEYLAFLRDPLRRIVSEYFYLKDASPNHPYHKWVEEAGSVEGWLRSAKRHRNIQSHRICGRTCETSYENAARILFEDYGFFGIQEEMPQSLQRLADWLGEPLPPMPTQNAGAYDPIQKEQAVQWQSIVAEEDAVDCSLYAQALTRFRNKDEQE